MRKNKITAYFLTGILLIITFFGVIAKSAAAEEIIKEPEQLYAQSAVLMDADTGRILFEKNGQEERPMASTTKIMTCILALENGNPESVVTASRNAAAQPEVRLGITEGRQFFLRDLLYSLMLESHNDAAVMIAEHIGGNVETFADMMNEKALELKCRNTYFITPNGLDETDEKGIHHTTAEDLARIMKYCIQDSPKHEEFLKITQTDSYQFTDCTNVYTYSCVNHNALLHMMQGALSGKTGFTNAAGYCYVGVVEKDGKKLIAALLACGWPNHKGYKWADMRKLMDYGFENFEYKEIKPPSDIPVLIVKNGVPDKGKLSGTATVNLSVSPAEKVRVLAGKNQKPEIQTRISGDLTAPVSKGITVGKVRYLLDGVVIKEFSLKTAVGVEERTFVWCLKQVARRLLFVIK